MIRKTIIVMLTLAAVEIFVIAGTSSTKSTIGAWRVTDHHSLAVASRRGLFLITHSRSDRTLPAYYTSQYTSGLEYPADREKDPTTLFNKVWLVFEWHRFSLVDGVNGTKCVFPAWTLGAVFATYPTIAFIRGPWRRYRRRKKGLCVKCGYDLTGNESGVCSECGSHI